jgi:hypothetical protein
VLKWVLLLKRSRPVAKKLPKPKSFSDQIKDLASEAALKGVFGTKRQVTEEAKRNRRGRK